MERYRHLIFSTRLFFNHLETLARGELTPALLEDGSSIYLPADVTRWFGAVVLEISIGTPKNALGTGPW
jgi:hypothetical protein